MSRYPSPRHARPRTSLLGRLHGWLPSGQASQWFIGVSFIDAIGTGLFLAGAPLFFTRELGLTTEQVGVGISLSGIAGLLGLVPVGRLADRLGGKRTLIALNLWRGVGFAVYPFVRGPDAFFVVAFLIGIAEWSVGPVVQAVVAAVEQGQSRVRTMAALGSVRNIGFTIGAVLATLVVAIGNTGNYVVLVLIDAGTFFITAGLLSRLSVATPTGARAGRPVRTGARLHDGRYLALTALNGLLYLHSVVLTVGLPLWIATRTSAPRAVVAAVVVVNTVIAIVLQVPLSKGSDDARQAARRQQWAGWSLAGCCVLVALTAHANPAVATGLVLAAALALTLGEIWQSVGAWGLSYAFAPPEQLGYYLSVYNLGLTGATVVGPVLVTFVVIRAGSLGWLGLAAAFGCTGLAVVL
nr:MFS transporter [Actinomycetota bacterium]